MTTLQAISEDVAVTCANVLALSNTTHSPSSVDVSNRLSSDASLSISSPLDDDSENESLFRDVSFLLEGARATTRQLLQWQKKKKKKSCSGCDMMIQVVVHCIDDEPGAVQSGHYLWPGAHILVDYLAQDDELQNDKNIVTSIIELGSGCAMASLVALQLFQQSLQVLICTDHDPGVLERAQENYESTMENLLSNVCIQSPSTSEDKFLEEDPVQKHRAASIPVHFEMLSWGSAEHVSAVCSILQKHTDADAVAEFGHQSTGHLILGSDLVYCAEVVPSLFVTAASLMRFHTNNNSNNKIDQPIISTRTRSRWILSQSFAYDSDTETAIDRMCVQLQLSRRTLLVPEEDNKFILFKGQGHRIQEFRPIHQPSLE